MGQDCEINFRFLWLYDDYKSESVVNNPSNCADFMVIGRMDCLVGFNKPKYSTGVIKRKLGGNIESFGDTYFTMKDLQFFSLFFSVK